MEKSLQGSEQKIQEYIARINAGESKDSIMQGLSPSFVAGIESGLREQKIEQTEEHYQKEDLSVPAQYKGLDAESLDFIWTIPEYTDPQKTKSEKERKQKILDVLRNKEVKEREQEKKQRADEVAIERIRKELGVSFGGSVDSKHHEHDLTQNNEQDKNRLIAGLIQDVSQGRIQAVATIYKNLFNTIEDPESRKKLASNLFQDVYTKYRIADYPIDPNEEQTWENALKGTKVPINNKKAEWMYRGIFPEKGEETVTRGSLNVTVTSELIDGLDNMIADGRIKANYKFGQPRTLASPTERHDSISIYFLEEPSAEALQELATIIKPYVRGDNLLGKKVDDGFFISEIGSIETGHIESFIEALQVKDPAFAEAVKNYTAPQPGRGTSLKMSEAQFYSIKDVARAFGYDISYTKDVGFEIH